MQTNGTHWLIEVSKMRLSDINEATERVWGLSTLFLIFIWNITDKIKVKISQFFLGIFYFFQLQKLTFRQ